MFEDLSDKEVLFQLQETETKIKQLKEDLTKLREENEKRKNNRIGEAVGHQRGG